MATSKPLGPGPGAYGLPTLVGYPEHDARKYRNPMYSFGVQTKTSKKHVGPGPGAYYPTKMTRYGPESVPKWSLYQRLDTKSKIILINLNSINVKMKFQINQRDRVLGLTMLSNIQTSK